MSQILRWWGVGRLPGDSERMAGVLLPISLAFFHLGLGTEEGRECLRYVRGPREGDESLGAEYVCAVFKHLRESGHGGVHFFVFSALCSHGFFHVDE